MLKYSFFIAGENKNRRNSSRNFAVVNRSRALILSFLFLCTLGLHPARYLKAQTLCGLTGTITDAMGAALPGATVTATNDATNIPERAATTAAGVYELTALVPGSYTLTVAAPGFHTYVRTHIVAETGVVSTINVSMEIGSASQTVEVRSEAIELNTTEPQLNTVIEPALLNALPIELVGYARQIDQFVFLTPGVQGNAWNKNMNGGLNFESGLVLNGIPIVQVNMQGQQTYMNPPFEMVKEFGVVQSTFSANYGLAQGVATYQTASGTNQYHGDAFEINRNSLFDSDGFFPSHFNAQGKPIPPISHQNNYGFTIGGPLTLPKLYSGKNRTFFHISTDWFKENEALTSIGTVPTVAMKLGDFSSFVDANGNQIPIYDPATGQQFPGNVIPQSRFSSIAKAILPSIPDPNRAGNIYDQQNNMSPVVHSAPLEQTMWGFTVDHKIDATQNVRYSMWEDNQHEMSFSQAPIVPVSNELQSGMNDYNYASGFLLDYSKTITPNLVATAGLAWVGILDGQANGGPSTNFPGVQGSQFFPSVTFSGQNAITPWGVGSGLVGNADRELGISLVNNWLWTRGRHSYNIGWEYRRGYDDTQPNTAGAGLVSFSAAETSVPNTSNPNFYSWGSSFASFLLGTVDSASRSNTIETRIHSVAVSPYIQDNVKLNKRLTASLGLRWDIMVPFEESNNHILYMDPHIPDPGASNLPGGLTIFGTCILCADITRASVHWRNFGPRLGFAYEINDKTIIQAGASIIFLNGGAYEFGSALIAYNMGPPLFAGEFIRSSTGSNVPGYGSWDANPIPNPPLSAFTPSMGNGLGVSYFDPKRAGMAPYEQAWSVNFQRQLPWNTFLNVAYVGNHAVHLPAGINLINQPSTSVLQYGSLLSQPVNSPAAQAAGIPIPYASFVSDFGGGATVLQSLRPFPQYASAGNVYDMAGTAEYKALQIQAEKRFSNGLGFLVSETLDRTMANQDRLWFTSNFSRPLNTFNQRAEWAIAANNQKYLTRIVATYQLPIGPGQMFLNHGIVADILGGWQLSGIGDYEGGFPFGVIDNYAGINGYNRPNQVPGVERKTYNYSAVKDYFVGRTAKSPVVFSTNAFALTSSPYVLGNGIRAYSELRTEPLRNESFSAMKSFHFGEKATATLRMDYFNAFNRTQFPWPDSNMSDSTFGMVTAEYSQITNRQGQATFRVEF